MADLQDGLAEPKGFAVLEIIMLGIIIFIFLVVVFIFFLHLYIKWCQRHAEQTTTGSRRHRPLVFAVGQDPRGQRRGLDPEILRSLPVLIFQQEEFEDGLECAVCLSELVQGEKARLLPKCNHGFHADCIDMWFHSHSTCPICRKPVACESSKCSTNSDVEENTSENNSQSSNSDVGSSVSKIYGNQTEACSIGSTSEEKHPSLQPPCSSSSTSSSSAGNMSHGMLMIDIPREINRSSSLPSSSRFAEDEQISPMITTLKSFKRLLSWNKRSGPSSPGSVDVEQSGKGEN